MDKKIEDYFPLVEHRLKNRRYQKEHAVCSCIARRVFAGVEIIGLEPLVQQRRSERAQSIRPVNIYIARHLSEFDWQEIQRALGGVDMLAAVQAGDNLFVGPLDPLLRHLGAFKVFREETRIFSDHWLAQSLLTACEALRGRAFFKTLFAALRLKRRHPLVVDSVLARDIYVAYMNHLICTEGRDILVFPEYSKDSRKNVKYGRSYSGRLLEFTPLIFKLIRDINKKTDRSIRLVPVNVSYERVVEDQSFKTLEQMKASKSRKRFAYLTDYFFNYTHWMYQRNKGRVTIKFGEPIVLTKKVDLKIRLHDDLRKKVGSLQTVFPTQVVGYAFADARELAPAELAERVAKTLGALRRVKADLRYVEDLSVQEIIQSAYEHFDLHRKRRLLVLDARRKKYIVKRPDVLSQYAHHIRHLFEKWHDKEHLLKIIDIFRDKGADEVF
jgi:1-acyl-sn-glycerol-3-phosphate acyltransferase